MSLRTSIVLLSFCATMAGAQAAPAAAAPAPAAPATAQLPPARYPDLPRTARAVKDVVPAGWRIESESIGDLNGDGRPDRLLVLREQDPAKRIAREFRPDEPMDSNPRMLAVLLAQGDGSVALGVANHSLIPRWIEPFDEDPLFEPDEDVDIARGAVRVRLTYPAAGAGGSITYTLRWQDGGLKLIGYDSEVVQRGPGDVDALSVNYVSGRAKRSHGKLDGPPAKDVWTTIPATKLLDIAEIGDGQQFNPRLR
jgi:hypothetical protein